MNVFHSIIQYLYRYAFVVFFHFTVTFFQFRYYEMYKCFHIETFGILPQIVFKPFIIILFLIERLEVTTDSLRGIPPLVPTRRFWDMKCLIPLLFSTPDSSTIPMESEKIDFKTKLQYDKLSSQLNASINENFHFSKKSNESSTRQTLRIHSNWFGVWFKPYT